MDESRTSRRSKPTVHEPKTDPLQGIAEQVQHIALENERLFQRLQDGERRFRGLARAVWQVQEDERRRLARELHDSIGQTLVGLIHQLERLDKRVDGSRAGAVLRDAQTLARTALDETRELSRLLRPPVLDDLGLEAALAWLVRTLRERTGLEAKLDYESGDGALDAELETLVFRVVQEALNNVIKHADKAPVTVQVRQSQARMQIQVADQGPGFDANRVLAAGGPVASSGLRGIHDRVQLFGGELRIHSKPGQGARLHITLPLTPA